MFSAQQTTSAATRPRHSAAVVSSLPSAANSLAASRGAVCGPFHSTPSSRTAASATAARLVARRTNRLTAAWAHVWSSFSFVVMALSFDLLSLSTPLNKMEHGCDSTRIPL